MFHLGDSVVVTAVTNKKRYGTVGEVYAIVNNVSPRQYKVIGGTERFVVTEDEIKSANSQPSPMSRTAKKANTPA